MYCDLEKNLFKISDESLQSQDTGMARKGKSPIRIDRGDDCIIIWFIIINYFGTVLIGKKQRHLFKIENWRSSLCYDFIHVKPKSAKYGKIVSIE